MPSGGARGAAVRALFAALLVGWAWVASRVRTFTHPAEVLTFLPGAAVLAIAVVLPDTAARPARRGRRRPGWGYCVTLLAAGIAWELWQLFHSPRSQHPTVSSLTDQALSGHPARFVAYLAWLLIGGGLLVPGWRRRTAR